MRTLTINSLRRMMRGLFSIRRHLIMKLNIDQINEVIVPVECTLLEVDHADGFIDGTYSIKMQKKIISLNEKFVDTFILRIDQQPIGIASVMYRGRLSEN